MLAVVKGEDEIIQIRYNDNVLVLATVLYIQCFEKDSFHNFAHGLETIDSEQV